MGFELDIFHSADGGLEPVRSKNERGIINGI